MDSNQLLVGLLGSVGRLELRRRHVVEIAVQPVGVVPVHPAERGQFDVLDALPGSLVDPRDNNTDVVSWRDATSSTQTPSR